MRKSIVDRLVMSVLAGVVFMAGTAQAATSYWGSASGNYTNAASWQSGGVPQAGDSAMFQNDAAYTATFTANWTNATAAFKNPTQLVTVDIGSGNTWTLTNGLTVGDNLIGKAGRVAFVSGNLDVGGLTLLGCGDPATSLGAPNNYLLVTNGAMVTSGALHVGHGGYEAGNSSNLLEVTGSGSRWVVLNKPMYLGAYKRPVGNTVRVSNGGYILVTNSLAQLGTGYGSRTNTLIVEGTGSLFEVAGTGASLNLYETDNRIVVTNGGTVKCSGGFNMVGDTQLLIDGGTFNMGVGTLNVRSYVRVSNGGWFHSEGLAYVISNATLIVTGPGSKVSQANASFYVQEGAYFEVSGGASNLVPRTNVGSAPGVEARMLLTGAASGATSELNMMDGRGRITIADGAHYYASFIKCAGNAGSTSLVEVTGSGSILTNSHSTISDIGQNGVGSLTVTNGGARWSLNRC